MAACCIHLGICFKCQCVCGERWGVLWPKHEWFLKAPQVILTCSQCGEPLINMLMTPNSISPDPNAVLHMLTGSLLPDVQKNNKHLKHQHIKIGHHYVHCPPPNPSNYNYWTYFWHFAICFPYVLYIVFVPQFIMAFFCVWFFVVYHFDSLLISYSIYVFSYFLSGYFGDYN